MIFRWKLIAKNRHAGMWIQFFVSHMIFHDFSWKSMIFDVFSLKINDFWWFFDENWLQKNDTPVCKLIFSCHTCFLMISHENQWFLMFFRWKSMIFDDFSMKIAYKKNDTPVCKLNFSCQIWFFMIFSWKSMFFWCFLVQNQWFSAPLFHRLLFLRGASGSSIPRTT